MSKQVRNGKVESVGDVFNRMVYDEKTRRAYLVVGAFRDFYRIIQKFPNEILDRYVWFGWDSSSELGGHALSFFGYVRYLEKEVTIDINKGRNPRIRGFEDIHDRLMEEKRIPKNASIVLWRHRDPT